MRESILQKQFPTFVRTFMDKHFSGQGKNGEIPEWVTDALAAAGISLNENETPASS